MAIELYDFQKECVGKLSNPSLTSRLVGDEMGLGKTLEAVAIDVRLRDGFGETMGKTLIVAPLSVHDHWRKHVLMIWPNARIFVIDRKDRPGFVRALRQGYEVYICHYEALRLKDTQPAIRSVLWFHIIADEVHRIKNRKAQQTRAIKALRAKYRTGLSGTPADNKPQDLWSVLHWLYPKVWTSYWRYVNIYCEQKTYDRETGRELSPAEVALGGGSSYGTTFKKIVGVNKATTPFLLKEMAPYYVRRLKAEVLTELPPKYHTDIVVELPPRQRRAYDQMRKDMLAWVGEHEDQALSAPVVIAQLVRLQQFALASPDISWKYVITRRARELAAKNGTEPVPERRMVVVLEDPSAKLDALEEIIEDNEDEPIVVFSQSRSMVDLVAARLTSKKIEVGRYTGTVPQAERDLYVERFQQGDLRVLAGTIAAGGESITLHRASTVVFLDRHWSPAKNVQAEDRLHRVGQREAVQVIDIIAKDTVDLGRRAVIASKWRTLKFLLGDTVNIEKYTQEVEQEGILVVLHGASRNSWAKRCCDPSV